MKQLSNTQSATELVGDINANLREMSSAVEVAVTDNAAVLVGKLNTALGVDTLSAGDTSQSFISKLNTAFADSSQPVDDGIDDFDESKYGEEMADTISKVAAVKDTTDLTLLVSTDIHHEAEQYKEVTVDGVTYQVPLSYKSTNGYINRTDTFSPMMANHKEFLSRSINNGIRVDAIASLGDFTDGMKVDYEADGKVIMTGKEISKEQAKRMLDKFRGLSKNFHKPLFMVVGNHDDNYDSSEGQLLGDQELSELFLQGTVDTLGGVTWESGKLDYYRDINGIRVVVLYCNNRNASVGNAWNITNESVVFLKSAVQDAESKNMKVLVLCHIFPSWSKTINTYATQLSSFLEQHDSTIIGYLNGHAHDDYIIPFPVSSITFCCNKNNDDGHPNDGRDMWNVVCIDTTNKIIHSIRHNGSDAFTRDGSTLYPDMDRVVHYEQIARAQGESQSFTATPKSGETVAWGLAGNSSSYYDSGWKNDSSASFVTMTQDGNTCTVTVYSQHASRIQHVLVYAYYSVDGTRVRGEYWTIKIPAQS